MANAVMDIDIPQSASGVHQARYTVNVQLIALILVGYDVLAAGSVYATWVSISPRVLL